MSFVYWVWLGSYKSRAIDRASPWSGYYMSTIIAVTSFFWGIRSTKRFIQAMASSSSSISVVLTQPSVPNCRLSSKTISSNDRKIIASCIFSVDVFSNKNRHISEGLDAYFNQWCMTLCQCCAIVVCDGSGSYEHLMKAIAILKRDKIDTETFNAEYAALVPNATSEEAEMCMVLATRLLSMLKIGPMKGYSMPGTELPWAPDPRCSIREHVNAEFDTKFEAVDVKLPRLFNACNMERIAGIEICWTSNLIDHLKMRDDDTTVTIFYHAAFLKAQMNSPE